jgi:hypothetical protein
VATPDTGRSGALDEARRLVAAGQWDEAAALLHAVINEARELLAQLDVAQPERLDVAQPERLDVAQPERLDVAQPAPAPDLPRMADARRSLALARGLLEEARFEEAVQATHVAWSLAPGSPEVFDEMIDIHCRVVTPEPDVQRFADEMRWLTCANQHDRSNPRVRGLIAERTYLHALQLHQQGRRDEALAIVKQSLAWDPERRSAVDLQQRLLRKRVRARATEPEPGSEG